MTEQNVRQHNDDRLDRAMISLEGLSIGDAFGETFFINPDVVENLIQSRALAAPPWRYTDDTLMALSVVSILSQYGKVEQHQLADSFAQNYDPSRGYGPSMHGVLACLRQGESWREVTQNMFGGQGSFGNGAAMRVAPLGAYFADDWGALVEQAARSAEVTHAHEEAVAGAIAVAIATAVAWKYSTANLTPTPQEYLDLILQSVPQGEVYSGLRKARDLPETTSVQLAVSVLGNGVRISAQDTVPFALWCAAQHLTNFEEALWLTVSGLGDRDTTCAIVGGIVAAYTGIQAIPPPWLAAREPLPKGILKESTAV